MQQRDRTWVVIFVLVLLLGSLAVLSPLLIPKGATRSFSSDNPGKSGVKGIYDLLRERGVRVQQWEKEWDRLPRTPGNVLFVIEPTHRGIGKKEISHLQDWVETGNTAVIWARAEYPLLDELGFYSDPVTSGPQTVAVAESSERWLRNIRRLVLPGNSRIRPAEEIEAVLTDLQGNILVARRELGRGQIFYIPEPEMITNRFIDQADNLALPLFFASFSERTLWFDESVPRLAGEWGAAGEEDPSSELTNWLKTQGIYVAAEAFIALLLWLYGRGKRFASPRWETVERFRNQDEFVEAMASLYRSFRLHRDSLEILERSFRHDVAKAMGFSPNVSRDRLIERISSLMGGESGRRFQLLMEEIDQKRKTKIKEKELIRLSQEMERCRREIRKWKIGQ